MKMMVKEFLYRGIPKEELESKSLENIFKLFNSRQRRSLTRGITDGKRKLIAEIKAAREGKLKNPIKTHLRDLIVMPYMTGVTVNVFSGKEFVPVEIKTEMIGRYLGEYVITNKKVSHGAPGVGASRSSLYVPLK
ncbi:MAG: 30S ribosomal protein S19 [Nitrosopumilus sp. B06]|nr:MAG: 30S ribosomal protein S19 [Nitrosopumilus sp. D6]RNJ80372.1 MAG: 30S ribosomal protein S19 [Nitrosopumilus sp. B06]